MKKWPWENPEKRSYTALREAEAQSIANGEIVGAATVDAVETAASFFAFCFAAAEIEGSNRARSVLTPAFLCEAIREVLYPGESVWYINVRRGKLQLIRSSYFQVYGSADPESWRYRLNLPAPTSGLETIWADQSDVIHLKYTTDKTRPWKGLSFIHKAATSGKLLAGLENMLANEASATSGSLLAFPSGSLGETEQGKKKSALNTLLGKLKASRGGTVAFQMASEPMALDSTKTAKVGVQNNRIGMETPEQITTLREPVRLSILSAAGIPPSLVSSDSATNTREAFRLFVFSRVMPLARVVATELSLKMNDTIKFDLSALKASDVSSRARSFKALVDAGMPAAQAEIVAGVTGEAE